MSAIPIHSHNHVADVINVDDAEESVTLAVYNVKTW